MILDRDDSGLFGEATALFSDDRVYRYNLVRRWSDGPLLRFVMLNPSTADAFTLDPTVSRCQKRAERLGYAGLLVQNIFAFRSTDPKGLYGHLDPVGPDNDRLLAKPGEQIAPVTVVAWGVHSALNGRGEHVAGLLRASGSDLYCLAVTKDGHPKHPLYCPNDARLQPWR